MKKEIMYPALSEKDYGCFRVSGPGLANCMYVAARAYVNAKIKDTDMIAPTWRKISIGPILRGERDKRVYSDLFYDKGITGFRKLWLLKIQPKRLVKFMGCGDYFTDLEPHYKLVQEYFDGIIRPKTIEQVATNGLLEDCVAVHVRLGDYVESWRVSLDWYKGVMENILKINPKQKFVIFSDGSDEELQLLLNIPNAERAFYGNAFADIWAISKCKMLIASMSTFSGWGAFLGRVPILFNKRNFPSVFSGNVPEAVIGDSTELPKEFKAIISNSL